MNRRNILKLPVLSLGGSVISRLTFAQERTSAAVVIGVDKPGDFPPLKAAASGARQVEKWLRQENYEVYPFIDDVGPVKASALYDTIASLITPPRFDKLLIYFAGHGLYSNGTETWLLNDALTNVQQAVNIEECLKLARESGLKNVIFISDACRSNPDNLRSARIAGSIIFPNLKPGGRPFRPDIDRFYAALPGRVSLETRDATDEYYGIYTSSLLDAFRSADQGMTKIINGSRVIPNRMLKRYLQADVPSRLFAKGIAISQQPDAITECDDDVYIGRYNAGRVKSSASTPSEELTDTSEFLTPNPGLSDVAQKALQRSGIDSLFPSTFSAESISASVASNQFGEARKAALTLPSPHVDDSLTGISVLGSDIIDIAASQPIRLEPIRDDSFPGRIYRCSRYGQSATTVVIKFANSGCSALAVLSGYMLNIVVDSDRIASISYTRSGSGDSTQIAELRATVAASTKFGVFRIEGNRQQRNIRAQQIADKIRVGKSFDPTLGIYAAYAYSDADLGEQVQSVRHYLKTEVGADIFDTAMLSGPIESLGEVVPFCPMLSQGWNLLRVKGAKLPSFIIEAGYRRRESLWTMFDDIVYNNLVAAASLHRN